MSNVLGDLVTRPSRAAQGSAERVRSAVDGVSVAGLSVIGAGLAAGAGLVAIALVVLVAWAASPGSGAGAADALRAVGQIWLLGHRVSLGIDGAGNIGLLPLGLLALPAYALVRAGGWVAHTAGITQIRAAVAAGLTLGGCYALLATMLATVAASSTVHPSPPQALVAGGCIGALFGTAGVVRGAGLTSETWAGVPPRAQSVIRGAAVAAGGVLAVGVVLVLGGLLLHPGRVAAAGRGLHPGAVGTVVLVLACVVYLPDAVVWAAAYAVGPGFAVGADTSVSPLGVHLGAVPAFPLLGALPAHGSAPLLALPSVLAPVVAGAAGGVMLIRRLPALRVEDAAGWGFVAGAGGAVALAVLAAVASGPVGPGRLAVVGPSAWQVGLAAALEMGLAGAVAAALAQRRLLAEL